MKLASFRRGGDETFGIVKESGFVDVGARLKLQFSTLQAVLVRGALDELTKLGHLDPDVGFDEVAWQPVIPSPARVLCAGINYRSHAVETERDLPEQPSIFLRHASTLVGHEDRIFLPPVSRELDYEGEVAVIVGRRGRYVHESEALAHVAGYTCFNDCSVRDYQRISVTAGKNFPRSGSLGPWMVTADDISSPDDLDLCTRLNGAEVQRSNTRFMIHSIPRIVAWCSQFTELEPGDVISTGTPEGVGMSRKPPLWMKEGDVVEVEIAGIGTLRNTVFRE